MPIIIITRPLEGDEEKRISVAQFNAAKTETAKTNVRDDAYEDLSSAEKDLVPKMFVSRKEILAYLGKVDTDPNSNIKGINFQFAATTNNTFIMTASRSDEQMGNAGPYRAYRSDQPTKIVNEAAAKVLYDNFRNEGKTMYLGRFQAIHNFAQSQLLSLLFTPELPYDNIDFNFEAFLSPISGSGSQLYYQTALSGNAIQNQYRISFYSCPPTCY